MEMKTLTKYAEGMQSGKKTSLTKCARAAGYSESYAPTAARRIKELMTQNESVRAMMESKGIGLECLVDDLGELRHAITPSGHPDNLIRQRNAEFRAQLLDALPPKRMELDERRVNITISGEDLERLKKHFGEIAIK